MPESQMPLNIVLGTMGFAKPGVNGPGTRIFDLEEMKAQLDVFQARGGVDLDSARMYGMGTGEELLKELDWQKRGLSVHTKLWAHPFPVAGGHDAESINRQIKESLTKLGTDKVDILYLHSPDRRTPFEATLKAVNELHKQGLFKELGISSYMSWEVAYMVEYCRANNLVQPTVYQARYSPLTRAIEAELLPCLRHYGIRVFSHGTTISGFLNKSSLDEEVEAGSRFDVNTAVGPMARAMIWNKTFFDAGAPVRAACEKHGITTSEACYRWIAHHSQLKKELGDAVLVSGSKASHVADNLDSMTKGPLPQDIVDAFDKGAALIKGVEPVYYF